MRRRKGGLGKGSIYGCFESNDELLAAIVECGFEAGAAMFATAVSR